MPQHLVLLVLQAECRCSPDRSGDSRSAAFRRLGLFLAAAQDIDVTLLIDFNYDSNPSQISALRGAPHGRDPFLLPCLSRPWGAPTLRKTPPKSRGIRSFATGNFATWRPLPVGQDRDAHLHPSASSRCWRGGRANGRGGRRGPGSIACAPRSSGSGFWAAGTFPSAPTAPCRPLRPPGGPREAVMPLRTRSASGGMKAVTQHVRLENLVQVGTRLHRVRRAGLGNPAPLACRRWSTWSATERRRDSCRASWLPAALTRVSARRRKRG